ncbi:oxygenase MpaB family protein [Sandaracinobacteroides sp. A072]|uniref:oxygenase MpaB family protein n=1 Tax=Sandaracinobacteroides sp. A072 TaxID=3461146 RepID=UPI0040424AA0
MSQTPKAREISVDFSKPAGEPCLLEPDSLHWRIYRNPIALGIGGVAAVLLEFADARIRSGVWDHSIYKVDPIGRSKRTGAVAQVGVYAPRSVARQVIGGVNRMHAKVNGETPKGEAYRALEPELLNWVSATAAYGFLKAYHNFVTPLSAADQLRFWNDGEKIGSLYGVTESPKSEADFLDMMNRLLPRFEPHPIVIEFLDIIQSGTAAPSVPRFLHRALARAAVSLLPPIVREKLELGAQYDLSTFDRLALKMMARAADRRKDPRSPPAIAAGRLGLPWDFAWMKPAAQQRLLAGQQNRQADSATAQAA